MSSTLHSTKSLTCHSPAGGKGPFYHASLPAIHFLSRNTKNNGKTALGTNFWIDFCEFPGEMFYKLEDEN